MTAFELILQILDISPVFNLSVKFNMNCFIDGRYMAILRLRGFGSKMPIRANFGDFWGDFEPQDCEIVEKLRTSCGVTRFVILRVKIGPAVSSVALFKY